MTEQEVRALLAIVVAYDNRRPTEANITAWWHQAELNRWGFDEAREAIHWHFAESPDFLMPVHVTARIKAERRQPGHVTPALEGPPVAEDATIRAAVAQVARRLRWNRDPVQRHTDRALTVQCPYCHAGPRRPCTRLATRGPHRGEHVALKQSHPSRIDLAGPQ